MNSYIFLAVLGMAENTALVAIADSITKARLSWIHKSLFGLLLTANAYMIRTLPITFGVHTIANIILLIILIGFSSKTDWQKTIVASFFAFILLILVETLVSTLVLSIMSLSPEQILQNAFLRAYIGIPHVIILFSIAFIINRISGRYSK